jgi:hypothetical protein
LVLPIIHMYIVLFFFRIYEKKYFDYFWISVNWYLCFINFRQKKEKDSKEKKREQQGSTRLPKFPVVPFHTGKENATMRFPYQDIPKFRWKQNLCRQYTYIVGRCKIIWTSFRNRKKSRTLMSISFPFRGEYQ